MNTSLLYKKRALDPGSSLKNTLIEHVFPTFAQGFIHHAQQQGNFPRDLRLLDAHISSPLLQPVYNATLIFIYRLLFLLYAGGRGLLPARDRCGLESLARLTHGVMASEELSNTGTVLYERLQKLFHDLNSDDGLLYSGNLFLADTLSTISEGDVSSTLTTARFLSESKISDRALAAGLAKLIYAEDPVTHTLKPIDYGNLPVRLLGSIYESLQAFTLQIAVEEMVIVKGRRADEVITYREAIATQRHGRVKRKYAPGAVYLVSDRRARRSTGSYYTPDSIVQYILEHTPGPVLAAKFAALADRFTGLHDTYATTDDDGIRRDDELVADFFDIKVLDPAMGSGHFLVAAVNYLATMMLAFLSHFPDNPVLVELASMRASLHRASAALNPPSDLDLLKRLLVKRCIFGVDLDPVAVELAKISLSLDSSIAGAPLPFLDAHLRCGNALIGARLHDLAIENTRRDAAPMHTALASIIDISKYNDLTPDEVRESRARFSQARRQLAPYKDALDGYLTRWFGNDVQAYRCFHWEIEFPEVFLARSGERAGFDAIIGNPPYINANELNRSLSAREKPYWKVHFASAVGAYDIYLLFMELAIRLSRKQGYSAFITPNKFLSAPYAAAFRVYYSHAAKMLRLLDASDAAVFADPSVYPVVLVSQVDACSSAYTIEVERLLFRTPHVVGMGLAPIRLDKRDQAREQGSGETGWGQAPSLLNRYTERLLDAEGGKLPPYYGPIMVHRSEHLDALPEKLWSFLLSDDVLPLLLKAQSVSLQLQQCALVHASTSASEADAYTMALSNEQTGASKQFINTGLIDRYATSWGMEALTHKGRTLATPFLALSHDAVSEARRSQYEQPKLIIAKMAHGIEAFFDEEGAFASANTNFVFSSLYDLKYLLALLNSTLLARIYTGYFGALMMRGGYIQFQAPQLRVLPIRRVAFVTFAAERAVYLEEARRYYQYYLATNDADSVMAFVHRHLSLRPERSDVIHDLLAFLAGTMQALHRERRAAQRASFEEGREIERRLALTDKLIDMVVYRFYDLSP